MVFVKQHASLNFLTSLLTVIFEDGAAGDLLRPGHQNRFGVTASSNSKQQGSRASSLRTGKEKEIIAFLDAGNFSMAPSVRHQGGRRRKWSVLRRCIFLLGVALLLGGQTKKAETTGATSPNPGVASHESPD